MVSCRKACSLFFLSFKIQSNPKTPSSTSSDIFPISSLANSGRNKEKKPLGDIKWRRRQNTAEAPAKKSKNSNDSTQAKNIFISSDRIQMWNKCQFMSQLWPKHMQWRVQAKKWQLSRVIKLIHGFRKQQHFSSHSKETHLARLTLNKTGQCFLYLKGLIAHECQTSSARN